MSEAATKGEAKEWLKDRDFKKWVDDLTKREIDYVYWEREKEVLNGRGRKLLSGPKVTG